MHLHRTFFGGIIHALVAAFVVGSAFAIGLAIDIAKYPIEFIREYGLFVVMIVGGSAVAILSGRRKQTPWTSGK